MAYFNDGWEFIRKHPKRFFLVIIMDAVFFYLFLPIMAFFIGIFTSQLLRLPMQAMGNLMQSAEGLTSLYDVMIKVLFGLIGSVIIFLLLILLNIAIFKTLIWLVTLERKIEWKIMLKGLAVTIIMASIFLIPFIMAVVPVFNAMAKFTESQLVQPSLADFLPLIIALFIIAYFFTLAYCFLARDGKIWRAVGKSFVAGIKKAHKILPCFLGLLAFCSVVFMLLRNLGILMSWGLIIFFVALAIVSFFNRVYIDKVIGK